jgi:hypothetical protein
VSIRGDGSRLVALLKQLTAAGTTVNGQVTLVDRERLGGNLRASIADVGRTAAAAEAWLGRAPGTMMSDRIGGLSTPTSRSVARSARRLPRRRLTHPC